MIASEERAVEKITSQELIKSLLSCVIKNRPERNFYFTVQDVAVVLCKLREEYKEFLETFHFDEQQPLPTCELLYTIWSNLKSSHLLEENILTSEGFFNPDEDIIQKVSRFYFSQILGKKFESLCKDFKKEIEKVEKQRLQKLLKEKKQTYEEIF